MTYRTIRGAEPDERIIAGLTHHLGPDEVPLVGASSSHFEAVFNKIEFPTLLVTNRRLLVAKDKLVGKPKPAVSVAFSDMASIGFGPLYGVGPTWEVHFHTTRNEPAVMYFKSSDHAESFKNALHDAATGTTTGEVAAGEPHGPSSSDAAFQARLQRLHNLVDDLRPLADRESLGRPFGEGYGLEEAMQSILDRLESPDEARQCSTIMRSSS